MLKERALEKRKNYLQKFSVMNAERTTKTFFDDIKSLGEDTQKQQLQDTLWQEETESFNKVFATF